MTIRTPTGDQVTAALGDGAKAAMAGMVGGPIGALAGGLLALASDLVPAIFGSDSKPALSGAAAAITGQSTEAAQVTALAKDPAATESFRIEALRIASDAQKQRDATAIQIQQMLMEQTKADQADTANARQMTAALAGTGSKIQWAQPVVSVCVTVGFFVSIGFVTFMPSNASPDVTTILNMLFGVLAAAFTQVVQFWLGSSHGSAVKTQLLANSVPASLLPSPAAVVPASDVQPADAQQR